MNSLNTFEKKGIIGSVILMIVILSVIRVYYPHIFLNMNEIKQENTTLEMPTTQKDDSQELERILRDAYTLDGELVTLVTKDVHVGTKSEPVKTGDRLEVHYVGVTPDGKKFDSSYDRGQTFSFTIGNGIVIKGWEEGLIGMKVGGKRILVIPSAMAYGNKQVGIIPPNTPLVFAVELIRIF
jgi:FKBP-type peptidyl-prolyl cis-trans isomerase